MREWMWTDFFCIKGPNMFAMTRRWRWRLLKCGLVAALLCLVAMHFLPSWGEMEAVERLKAAQRRHEKMLRETGGHGMDDVLDEEEDEEVKGRSSSGRRGSLGNEILPGPTKKRRRKAEAAVGGGGYRNSQTLQEQLKPKLISRGGGSEGELWNDLGAAHNAQDLEVREEGYRRFAFNSLVSRRLGLRREQGLPDTRHPECRKKEEEGRPVEGLPSASVVICFYHEELEVLLRTVYSVLDRTPRSLLKEIILVNDHSDIDITSEIEQHLKVRVCV